jgi:hypothetical protein
MVVFICTTSSSGRAAEITATASAPVRSTSSGQLVGGAAPPAAGAGTGAAEIYSEKRVRLAQKMQVGPCIPVGLQR